MYSFKGLTVTVYSLPNLHLLFSLNPSDSIVKFLSISVITRFAGADRHGYQLRRSLSRWPLPLRCRRFSTVCSYPSIGCTLTHTLIGIQSIMFSMYVVILQCWNFYCSCHLLLRSFLLSRTCCIAESVDIFELKDGQYTRVHSTMTHGTDCYDHALLPFPPFFHACFYFLSSLLQSLLPLCASNNRREREYSGRL